MTPFSPVFNVYFTAVIFITTTIPLKGTPASMSPAPAPPSPPRVHSPLGTADRTMFLQVEGTSEPRGQRTCHHGRPGGLPGSRVTAPSD